MGIFDRIKHALFGEANAAEASTQSQSTTPPSSIPSSGQPATAGGPAQSATVTPAPTGTTTEQGVMAAEPTPSAGQSTGSNDIEAILDEAVAKSGQRLDWRHSIVDLMKALGMDASLEERKELAGELDYTGDLHDSATMNTFLHKALLKKLSENGGKVPANLLD
jgi:hypothetical protein